MVKRKLFVLISKTLPKRVQQQTLGQQISQRHCLVSNYLDPSLIRRLVQ